MAALGGVHPCCTSIMQTTRGVPRPPGLPGLPEDHQSMLVVKSRRYLAQKAADAAFGLIISYRGGVELQGKAYLSSLVSSLLSRFRFQSFCASLLLSERLPIPNGHETRKCRIGVGPPQECGR